MVVLYHMQLDPRQRDSQMFEIYKFVEQTRGADPVILTGDYNTKPNFSSYKFLMSSLGLEDAFCDNPLDTCDLTSNIFTKKHMTPKRIDFVFYTDKEATSLSMAVEVCMCMCVCIYYVLEIICSCLLLF